MIRLTPNLISNDLDNCISSGKLLLSQNTYQSICSNINDAPINKIIFISATLNSDTVTNLPLYNNQALLLTCAYNNNIITDGILQIYISINTPEIYYRIGIKTSTTGESWGDWIELIVKEKFNTSLNNIEKWALSSFKTVINNNNYSDYFTDAKNAPINKIIFISASINSSIISDLPNYNDQGILLTPAHNINGGVQFYITRNSHDVYYRFYSSGVYKNWAKIAKEEIKYKDNLFKIIHSVGIIGDSLSVGWIEADPNKTNEIGDLYRRNEEYSWGGCIKREYGINVKFLGQSGYTIQKWLSNAETYHGVNYGVNLLQKEENQLPFYIICLGYNDVNADIQKGTINDIGVDQTTFYGGYGAIISACKSVKPDCKIFCMTMPNPTTKRAEYNNAIRDIVNNSNFNNIYLLDMDILFSNEFKSGTFIANQAMGGHYTPIGYQAISILICKAISETIYNNLDDFKYINYI